MATNTSHKQHPIGTGFTPASTAEEVIAGIDLTGKNVVVTGGHSGLGREATRVLSQAGASVTVAVRDPERAATAVAGIDGVETGRLDLADPASIDAFAERWLDSARPLHILINNAGIMGGPLVRDARGHESHFAINHLGHFQLTNGLLPALRAADGARVVNMTSGGHRLSGIRWDDPHFTTGEYDWHVAYGQSKTANVLFAVELDRRWADDGIRGYAVHPGIILSTNLGPARPAGEVSAGPPLEILRDQGLVDADGNPVIAPEAGLKTLQQGAGTMVFAATSPLLDGIGGVYLKDNDISPVDPTPPNARFDGPPPTDVAPHAIDPEAAERLWTLSERLLAA
ncbi:SDR family NAD(P)-dependent oxidoreductase [Thermomonospora cellulosilytica]|uniref:NAD(P)-dependent dehydrogenase (Short-subunit alcohol dehydrogenase family) n=1 Tax=Thermomonospora cellulosilytica TaxID=1411118 RepID=A0A7W3MW45_9ACTN|nr:SDR family NAD(P)-dependent oxidoreductase [Thermomonospora cellulosilytica]MBA9003009.1 NAD(P)-dependent dehydrogenase (short-subunit alcohol dehydrogenase family) [Thermomonospora cellulosilytica]